ncbi:MAG: hypothetical protein Q9166_004504 [cf. Caloplaca sp. 2 TL-2023]
MIGEPHRKRQKLDLERNSQNTPHIVRESDEEEQLMRDDFVKVRHVTEVPRDAIIDAKKLLVSHRTIQPTERNIHRSTRAPGYYNVEKLMDSSLPNHKERKSQQRSRTRGTSATAGSSFASSPSSVEILKEELTSNPVIDTKAVYRGTANLHPPRYSKASGKPMSGRSTADRSPHFPPPAVTEPVGTKQPPKKVGEGPSITEPRLRDQYRDSNGKPRGDIASVSSDELLAQSDSRALSPVKSTRSQSPTKISQCDPMHPALIEDELDDPCPAQSVIKPSVFTKPANNGIRSKVCTYQHNYQDEKPAPWSMPLRAYSFQGEIHKDDSLALVYDDDLKSYDIRCNGTNLSKRNLDLRIQPKKLQKIRWALGGTKMRFESSKTGSVDNILDIELCGEKDVQSLNASLQEYGSLDVKGLARERMDQLFEHRLREHRKVIDSRKSSASRVPEDVQLAGLRLDRADKRRASEEQRQSTSKRPRVVDALRSKNMSDDNQRVQNSQSIKRSTNPNHEITMAHSKADSSDEVNLKPLEDKLRADALTYALRSHNASGCLSRKPKEIPPMLFNEDIQRYSKTKGLGRPWPRPLVYPPEGRKRTTVNWTDLERLDEGEFLNDNLIAFYLRYLEYQAELNDPTVARKVYMFNSFFYNSLTSTKAGHKGINYDGVKKWTRGIDIFTYDFVVVPVNESAHWYVAIICNLPALNRQLGGFDAELAQGFGSPNENHIDQSTEGKHPLSSSPRAAASDADHREASPLAENAVEDPKERETAASFAEMSLEANGTRLDEEGLSLEIPGAFDSDHAKQELLDGQLQYPTEEDPHGNIDDAQEPMKTSRDDDGVVEMEKSPLAQQKQRKRKSLPSPRVYNPYKPTILTFDSFGTPHPPTVKVLKQYLHEEASDKRGHMEFDEKELQGVTAKQIPQQDNFCDCGLFLLGYMEKFFDNPREFIDKVMRKEWDVQRDWPKLDPSSMRNNMRELLMGLEKNQRLEKMKAKRVVKTSKGPKSSPSTARGDTKLTGLDGTNSTDQTPTKPGAKAAQPAPPTTRNAALESGPRLDEPNEQPVPSSRNAVLEYFQMVDEPVQQSSPSSRKATLDSAKQIDEPVEQASPTSRKAALEFARPIDDPIQQQASDAESKSSRTIIKEKQLTAEAHQSAPATTEEPPPQSFFVPDSQSEPSNTPKQQKSDKDPESLAISPELPSTIQDSQPSLPVIPLVPFEDTVEKDATPPPPTKPRRHIESFSSPLPSKTTRVSNTDRRTPQHTSMSKTEQSSPETRSKKRPILGARPAIVETDPKVVINID